MVLLPHDAKYARMMVSNKLVFLIIPYYSLFIYADDTTAFLTGDDFALTHIRINDDVQHIHCWLQVKRLTLNINMSSFMVTEPQSIQKCP